MISSWLYRGIYYIYYSENYSDQRGGRVLGKNKKAKEEKIKKCIKNRGYEN